MKKLQVQIKYTFWVVLSLVIFSTPIFGQTNIEAELSKLEKLVEVNDKSGIASSHNKLGSIYWQNNQNNKAIYHYQQSLELNNQLGNKNAQRIINEYLGLIFLENEEYQNAISHFEKSLSENKKKNKTEEIISDCYNIATAYQMMGNYSSSNIYAERALEKSLETDKLDGVKSCYLLLAENSDKLGNKKQASDYYDKYNTLINHLRKQEMVKMESEKKKEVALLESEKKQIASRVAVKEEEFYALSYQRFCTQAYLQISLFE